jgi:hypothetical protein
VDLLAVCDFLEIVVPSRCFHWGLVDCNTLSCLCAQLQDVLHFIQCYRVHAIKSGK